MVLDNKNRGLLEKEIDSTIVIPIFIKKYQDSNMKARLQYRDETDFVLGLAWGKIIFTFTHNFWIIALGTSVIDMLFIQQGREVYSRFSF